MIAKALVQFYCFVHGTLHLPGAGWLIRRVRRWVPELRSYPHRVPGLGTAMLDFNDDGSFGFLNYLMGGYGADQRLLEEMERALPEGSVLWDVGANLGFITTYFARRKPALRAIHAFEPNPGPLRTLQSLYAGHSTVSVHPIGLGATDENATMHVTAAGSAYGSVVRTDLQNSHTIPIPIRRGDNYAAERKLEQPDAIKIDVEGFEPKVLAGLSRIIDKKRPIIFFEHIFLKDEDIRALIPAGYRLDFILEDGSLTGDFAERMQGYNAILSP